MARHIKTGMVHMVELTEEEANLVYAAVSVAKHSDIQTFAASKRVAIDTAQLPSKVSDLATFMEQILSVGRR